MDQKDIDRINELYHKAKKEGLTPEETREQAELRGAYIRAFRENLRGQLETIKIQNCGVRAIYNDLSRGEWAQILLCLLHYSAKSGARTVATTDMSLMM